MEELKHSFRPEFLNRIDEVILFHRLDKSHLRRIVDIQLARFAQRLARRELSLYVEDSARDLLGELGWDPVYGARPLKRAIQQQLENPLAQRILAGDFAAGETVRVGRNGTELNFERAQTN